jgi:hypothetical protein
VRRYEEAGYAVSCGVTVPRASCCHAPWTDDRHTTSAVAKAQPLHNTPFIRVIYFAFTCTTKPIHGRALFVSELISSTLLNSWHSRVSLTPPDTRSFSVYCLPAQLWTCSNMFEQLAREQRDEYMNLHAYNGFGTHKILSNFKTSW